MAAGAHQEVFSFVQFVQADGTDIFRLLPITLVTVNLNWGLIRNSQLCEGCGGCMCRCEGVKMGGCDGYMCRCEGVRWEGVVGICTGVRV